jgi:hypothetical protein
MDCHMHHISSAFIMCIELIYTSSYATLCMDATGLKTVSANTGTLEGIQIL